MSISQDLVKCMRFISLGCFGGKKFQQAMICQWLMMGGFLYFWIYFNGGLWPSFLRSAVVTPTDHKSDILNHFRSDVFGDGLKVTWAHAVNSRKRVAEFITGEVMMIEGDVVLKGQGTSQQQLIPVMAHPPDTDSDITLREWLNLIQNTGKGIKLDFKSIESVDMGLQLLNERRSQLKVPIHLSAEVVEGPNNFMAPNKILDPTRFIRQCREKFPDQTLALGWTNGWSEQGEQLYTWAMAKAMYDIMDTLQIHQQVTFNVRARLAKNSVAQLKWLMEMTDGSLSLFSPIKDNLNSNDILSIRHRFPKEKVFYDIDASVKSELEKVPLDGGIDERLKFQVSQWKAIRSKGGEKIYLGSEALVFQNGLLISKQEYQPQNDKPMISVEGRVEFISIPTASDTADSASVPVGLGVYLRVSQSSQASIISGIRCFIGVSGHVEVSTQSIPGVDRKEVAEVPGTLPCFRFKITDFPDVNKISVEVTRLKTCNDVVPQPDEDNTAKVEFSMKDIETNFYFMALRAPAPQAFVVVDEFILQ